MTFIIGSAALVLSITVQILLVVILLPLSAIWWLCLAYWISFQTVSQMLYRLIPLALSSLLLGIWLAVFEAARSI